MRALLALLALGSLALVPGAAAGPDCYPATLDRTIIAACDFVEAEGQQATSTIDYVTCRAFGSPPVSTTCETTYALEVYGNQREANTVLITYGGCYTREGVIYWGDRCLN